MKILSVACVLLAVWGSALVAQQEDVQTGLFDPTIQTLGKAVMDSSQRQTGYSYNVANVLTPKFKPVFFPEDAEYLANLPKGNMEDKDSLEYFMTRMSENRNRQAAYVKLYNIKMGILRQVVTLGKK